MGAPQPSGFLLASITYLQGETNSEVLPKTTQYSFKSIAVIVPSYVLISEAFSGPLTSLKVEVLIGCLDWTALVGHEPFPHQVKHHPASHPFFTSPPRSVLRHLIAYLCVNNFQRHLNWWLRPIDSSETNMSETDLKDIYPTSY